jgi:hypothetical protein
LLTSTTTSDEQNSQIEVSKKVQCFETIGRFIQA